MIKKNHTYKITTEEKKDLIVTPIEHTPKVVETVEQNEVPLENQATQNIVECTEERINEISQATGKDPLQVEYEKKKHIKIIKKNMNELLKDFVSKKIVVHG